MSLIHALILYYKVTDDKKNRDLYQDKIDAFNNAFFEDFPSKKKTPKNANKKRTKNGKKKRHKSKH